MPTAVTCSNPLVCSPPPLMTFPSLDSFEPTRVGAYELQMGRQIEAVLAALAPFSRDRESNAAVLALLRAPERWKAGHTYFCEVRDRLLLAREQGTSDNQYWFEEACCQAVYNATNPQDPFDPSSAYFVVPFALTLAQDNPPALTAVLQALGLSPAA